MSTYNLCFEQKYEKYQSSKNFQILEVKFSIYLNSHVFVMDTITMQLLHRLNVMESDDSKFSNMMKANKQT